MTQPPDRWDRFELFVLRFCRSQYLALAILGAIATVGGGVAALGGVVLPDPARPQLPPDVPPLEPLRPDAVQQLRSTRPQLFDVGKVTAQALNLDNASAEMSKVPAEARDLFPEPTYVWEDVVQDYCRVPTDYGCLERSKRITKVGMRRVLATLFVGVSNSRSVFDAIKPVLVQSPADKRAELVLPAGIAFLDSVHARDQAVADRQAQVDELEAKHATAVQERRAQKGALVLGGLYAIGSGLSAMLLAGLFLAFLAVERHLRALREGASSQPRDAGSSLPSSG